MDMEEVDTSTSLRGGDPLRSYFPTGTQIRETREGLMVQEPATGRILRYQKPSSFDGVHEGMREEEGDNDQSRVRDIIITGEASSL